MLRDANAGHWQKIPSLYAWAQFVPTAWLTKGIGMPLILTGLLWRTLGGLLFGASLFILFRRLFNGTTQPLAWTMALCLICLSDPGLIQGRLLAQSFTLPWHMLAGTTPYSKADGLHQYRVVQPLLHLPLLLLLAANLLPGRPHGLFAKASVGILLLGSLVLLNFYFWTAAVLGLGLYLCALAWNCLKDPAGKSAWLSKPMLVAAVLAGGLTLGSPQILSNWSTFSDPQSKAMLKRSSRGATLKPGHPYRAQHLKNRWAWLKISLGALALLLWRLPGISILWCLTLAGFLLANSALVTGLEFENSHWSYIHAPLGGILVLTIGVLMLDKTRAKKFWLNSAGILGIGLALMAISYRPYEALRAPEAVRNSRILSELELLRPALASAGADCSIAGPPETQITVLFSRCGLLHPPGMSLGTMIPAEEIYERNALNAWLQGYTLEHYLNTDAKEQPGLTPDDDRDVSVDLQAREKNFRRLLENPESAPLDRYHADILLLPAAAEKPRRGGPWKVLASAPKWILWTREA